jgi:hypothetical protein
MAQMTRGTIKYFDAYGLFKVGVMPNGIGWLNESEKFLQAMKFIQNEIRRTELQNAGKK